MPNTYPIKDKLFSFALITDTHLNPNDNQSNSPFMVNQKANQRLRYVIDDLNQRELLAVFHLGDIVHPVPSMADSYERSASRFFEQVSHLKHPLHIIAGNHDVGDKKISWGPSGVVRDSFLSAWSQYFGAHYFHLNYGGIEFIGINAQLIGSGLDMECEQQIWLQQLLEQLKGKRLMILSHYPPFLDNEFESEHYDNLGITGRQWLLGLIKQYKVEALFCGHVHHFWYNRYAQCNCFLLPSTAFVRQDYSEMFRIKPSSLSEFGRNDVAKLGYLIIHIYQQGHNFELVRCLGLEKESISTQTQPNKIQKVSPVSALTNQHSLLGFDLRQDWAERVQIPPSGALDEFNRKWVRNDYAMLALWEMGVVNLRIPLLDISEIQRAKRIKDLANLGFKFCVYCFGIPNTAELLAIEKLAKFINTLEITWCLNELNTLELKPLDKIKKAGIDLYLSPLRSKDEIIGLEKIYYHVINHGLTSADIKLHLAHKKPLPELPKGFVGWVFRTNIEEDIVHATTLIREYSATNGTKSIVHLRLSGDNPAKNNTDEMLICKVVADAMLTAWLDDNMSIFCDTLADNDRGYFPRSGVVDRLFNPKDGLLMIKNMHAIINELTDQQQLTPQLNTTTNVFGIQFGQKNIHLLLANSAYKITKETLMIDLFTGVKYKLNPSDTVKKITHPHLMIVGLN